MNGFATRFFFPARQILLSIGCALLLAACGGGSAAAVGADPVTNPGDGVGSPGDPADGSEPPGGQTGDQAGDNGSGDSNDPPTTPPVVSSESLIGSFMLDEFEPGFNPRWNGVIRVQVNPVTKARLITGNRPRRQDDGSIVYRRACGQFVWQYMLADSNLRARPLTPCGSELTQIGNGRAQFEFAQLSTDGTRLAVETRVYNGSYQYRTLIFDTQNLSLIADWQQSWSPVFLPSGRLLLSAANGFFQLDENFDNPTKFGDFEGSVANPAVSPDGSAIAFEYNQQIWGMNADGTGARSLIIGGARLKYPAWSPDGKPAIAYLVNTRSNYYEQVIFVTNIQTGENASINLKSHLDSFLVTVNGPLTWYR